MVYTVASAAVLCTTVLGDDEEAKVPCQGAGVKVPRGAGKLAAGPVCARAPSQGPSRGRGCGALCAVRLPAVRVRRARTWARCTATAV